MNILASNLLAKREEKRFTQSYVATLCGMSQPNYSDIERGKTTPSIKQLIRFAEVYETTVDALLAERVPAGKSDKPIPEMTTKKKILTEADKDTYIKILENRLKTLLAEKAKKD